MGNEPSSFLSITLRFFYVQPWVRPWAKHLWVCGSSFCEKG